MTGNRKRSLNVKYCEYGGMGMILYVIPKLYFVYDNALYMSHQLHFVNDNALYMSLELMLYVTLLYTQVMNSFCQ